MAQPKKFSNYIDLKTNGRLFPSWIVANFSKYKLPEIMKDPNVDACNIAVEKDSMKQYQLFIGKILDYNGPYKDLLVYHGLGSGKTASTINLYNVLYNSNPGWNVFLLLKATLKNNWINELNKWLQEEDKQFRMENIKFISYDAPNADKAFMDAVKNSDSSKKNLYIIEEAHNFIRNVYSNITSKVGKRAQSIYDYILQDKRESEGVRVILLTATPTINRPYELGLIFNLLRPGIFPKSEAQFNQIYISGIGQNFERLNPAKKNNFQRRIMGLVSYYIGATPDYFASKKIEYVDVMMSEYQDDIYKYFEGLEDSIMKKSKRSQTYMSYTRQSCNFVFPIMAQGMTGESRPRPRNFKMVDKIDRGKDLEEIDEKDEKHQMMQKYLDEVNRYADTYDSYLNKIYNEDKSKNYSIIDDIKKIREQYVYDVREFAEKESKRSKLFDALYASSAKMIYMIMNILRSPGPVLVYSNYVLMEGLQIFKIYLKYFGFSLFKSKSEGVDDFRYVEYHGMIDQEQRANNIKAYNDLFNKHGKIIKIIMISPAGAEGLSLFNTRQVHIMEPYWHEVRIEQMIGRALRLCSHKYLPMDERHVDVFRYKSVKRNKDKKITADQLVENLARSKQGLLQSFEDAVKEVAIDCELFKNHNLLVNDYKCFKFDEPSFFEEQIGPAYKDDIQDDMRIDNGMNSINSEVVRIKVNKISAVKIISMKDGVPKYSEPEFYWYNPETNVVYDFEMHYAIGKVGLDDDLVPLKLDEKTYIIDKVIPIPHLTS